MSAATSQQHADAPGRRAVPTGPAGSGWAATWAGKTHREASQAMRRSPWPRAATSRSGDAKILAAQKILPVDHRQAARAARTTIPETS